MTLGVLKSQLLWLSVNRRGDIRDPSALHSGGDLGGADHIFELSTCLNAWLLLVRHLNLVVRHGCASLREVPASVG